MPMVINSAVMIGAKSRLGEGYPLMRSFRAGCYCFMHDEPDRGANGGLF